MATKETDFSSEEHPKNELLNTVNLDNIERPPSCYLGPRVYYPINEDNDNQTSPSSVDNFEHEQHLVGSGRLVTLEQNDLEHPDEQSFPVTENESEKDDCLALKEVSEAAAAVTGQPTSGEQFVEWTACRVDPTRQQPTEDVQVLRESAGQDRSEEQFVDIPLHVERTEQQTPDDAAILAGPAGQRTSGDQFVDNVANIESTEQQPPTDENAAPDVTGEELSECDSILVGLTDQRQVENGAAEFEQSRLEEQFIDSSSKAEQCPAIRENAAVHDDLPAQQPQDKESSEATWSHYGTSGVQSCRTSLFSFPLLTSDFAPLSSPGSGPFLEDICSEQDPGRIQQGPPIEPHGTEQQDPIATLSITEYFIKSGVSGVQESSPGPPPPQSRVNERVNHLLDLTDDENLINNILSEASAQLEGSDLESAFIDVGAMGNDDSASGDEQSDNCMQWEDVDLDDSD